MPPIRLTDPHLQIRRNALPIRSSRLDLLVEGIVGPRLVNQHKGRRSDPPGSWPPTPATAQPSPLHPAAMKAPIVFSDEKFGNRTNSGPTRLELKQFSTYAAVQPAENST